MKRILILLSFALIGFSITAQDLHFSQYYASPLTLNPALTGKFDGLYRVSAIYRDQWRNIVEQKSNTFMTPSVSVDFSLLRKKNNALGVGVVVNYDKVGPIDIIDAGLSAAYHLSLDKKGNYHIALGFQGMYSNKKISSDFKFGDELEYDLATSPDDQISEEAHHLFSLTPGLLFDAKIGKSSNIYLGYSLFMNLTPKQDIFLASTTTAANGLPMRHVAHIGAEFGVKKFLIIPGALFQTMSNTDEINFGITAGYKVVEKPKMNAKIFLGLWYRLNTGAKTGTFIPKLGLDIQNFRLSGAYDLTAIGLMAEDSKNATNVGQIPQAFEIAISYFGQGSTPKPTNTYLFNPRF